MSEGTKQCLICCTAIAIGVLAFFALMAVLCVRVSTNDHAKILRDGRVKVACIQSGQSVLHDECLPRR